MPKHDVHEHLALLVRQYELFGEVGEDAQTLRPRIDHEIHGAALPVQVEAAVVVEDCRNDGEDAAHCHRFGVHTSGTKA